VLTASDDNTARIWDADSGEQIALLKGHTDCVVCGFSPDGKRVVTASSVPALTKGFPQTRIDASLGHDD
jgi:WD40 repeat protein